MIIIKNLIKFRHLEFKKNQQYVFSQFLITLKSDNYYHLTTNINDNKIKIKNKIDVIDYVIDNFNRGII